MRFLRLAASFILAMLCVHPARGQVVGQSINMVTGMTWPNGDPFLERQNEPSMAVSSRNPMHLIAGNNDYRTVDIPGIQSDEPTGDAWLGFFTSMDGGNSWQSTLVPGYPQDSSTTGKASPLSVNNPATHGGYNAAADPTVRAGTNGMVYYSGIAFSRENTSISGGSAIFLARYVDDNNYQGANTVRYIDTHVLANYNSNVSPGYFADKPFLAVDMPRDSSTCTIPGNGTVPAAKIPAGRMYIAYTLFTGGEASSQSSIMLTSSSDCGVTWSTPQQISRDSKTNQGATLAIDPKNGNLYIAWRIFPDNKYANEIHIVNMQYGTNTFTPVSDVAISPFDQGTSGVSFRTNAYPSLAVDNSQRLYIGWSQRGSATNTVTGGDARIQVIAAVPTFHGGSTAVTGLTLSNPITVDPYQDKATGCTQATCRGHQIMPALAFSSGKLTVAWYDFRNDDEVEVFDATGEGNYSVEEEIPLGVTPQFSNTIQDPANPTTSEWRQTVDIRAAQALPAPTGQATVQFGPSVSVSEYAFGTPVEDTPLASDPDHIQQLEFNPPDLPLFSKGTAAFVGDYIDVAGPTFIFDSTSKAWRFNNLVTDPDYTHVVWTDNRNVVQPADTDWTHYTPLASQGTTASIFDPTQQAPKCIAGQTGVRNQDIYTASLSPGVTMGVKGNSKQLSTTLTREFPVTVENPTNQTLYFLLTIQSQPPGGTASFVQYPVSGIANPLTQLTIGIPPFSSASRSVFITSSNPSATVAVNAIQTNLTNNVVPLTSSVTLNSDISNPSIANPSIANVELYNPSIANPSIANPSIANPSIANPSIANPSIANPSIANPSIANPSIANPSIANPSIANPSIANPSIANAALSGEITDFTYNVTNSGNTSTSYAVNLVGPQPPAGITVQLIISGVYLTPVANTDPQTGTATCALTVQPHYNTIVNDTSPVFQSAGFVPPVIPSPTTPSFSLEPGEQALITLRVYDPNATTLAQALSDYNPLTSIQPVISSQGINTNVKPPAPGTTVSVLTISTASLPTTSLGTPYSLALQANGGVAPYTWTASPLPPGIAVSGSSLIGAAKATGIYTVDLQVTDSSGQTAQRTLTLNVPSSLTVATTTLPAGRFGLPYSLTLSAVAGTGPYRWSLGQGAALPTGMSLNSTGVLSGAPAQAGQWTIPVTVTDSATPPNTANGTLPLTVGLSTAFASGYGSCTMPMPATPLYYPGATSWTADTSALGDYSGEIQILNGNILTGCLNGGFSSGNYALNLTAYAGANTLQTLTMNLPVVAQGAVLNNGTVQIVPNGGLPPGGLQQGVAAPLTTFNLFSGDPPYSPITYPLAGNYLFGLEGSAPQQCYASQTINVPFTAPSPGRFDLLFNSTTQNCPASAFPSTPQTLAFASVDAIGSSVSFAEVTVSSVSVDAGLGNSTNVLEIPSGQSGTTIPITLSFNYSITSSGSYYQIEFGLNTDSAPQAAFHNGSASNSSGTASISLSVPNVPGRYYVGIDRSAYFDPIDPRCSSNPIPGCLPNPIPNWWDGPPNAGRYIAIVDVLGPGLG